MNQLYLALLILAINVFAQTNQETTLQVGLEKDTNVFKSFGQSVDDENMKVLFNHKGQSKDVLLYDWNLQAGSKLFATQSSQNQVLGSLDLSVSKQFSEYVGASIGPWIKYQNESNLKDDDGLDVNEDYLLGGTNLQMTFSIGPKWTVFVKPQFHYFHFYTTSNFSYLHEAGNIETLYEFIPNWKWSLGSTLSFDQFRHSLRSDRSYEIYTGFKYLKAPYLSVRYLFEKTNSSQDLFSYDRHAISFLLSSMHYFSKTYDLQPRNALSFQIMGTVQIRKFDPVYDFAQEGQRFLLTDNEDETFNSVVAKLAYHVSSRLAFETKYTRYSNEFSSIQDDFQRQLFYFGIRSDL